MKVLVIRLSSFGDQIHVCPAVADLKRQRPDIEIHWLVQSEFAAVPQVHSSVDRVIPLPLQTLKNKPFSFSLWKSCFKLLKQLRNKHYDVSLDTQGVIKSALMSFLVGANLKLGYARSGLGEKGAYWFYHKHFHRKEGLSSVSQAREFVRWAFQLEPISDSVEYGLAKQRPLVTGCSNTVLFVPFASHPSKMLSTESWLCLARVLCEREQQLKIKISWGSEREFAEASELAARYSDFISPVQSKLDFKNLIQSLLHYRLVIGLDTGITHLANALGIPTVMIFKASSPKFFFTPGSNYARCLGSVQAPPSQKELEASVLDLLQITENGVDAGFQ